jgi:tRNA threonylcarbamoyladenosine biosynthesis protein TsaE
VPHITLELATTSAAGTRAVGGALAGRLRAGDVVALSGELGAGKTALVQGAAEALGVALAVTSPTFVLVKHLPAPVPVVHVDVYRLEWLAHVDDLDEDVFAPDVVTFVEWAERIAHLLPDDRLEVHLEHADPELRDPGHADPEPHRRDVEVADAGPDDAPRRLRVIPHGAGWLARLEALEHDLASWLRDT